MWEISYDDAMSALARLRNNLIRVALLTMVVVTGVGFLIARSISRPLQDLQKGLQRFVATGDLTIRVGQIPRMKWVHPHVRLMKSWQ